MRRFEVKKFLHLGLKLRVGMVYTEAELRLRCKNDEDKLAKLETMMADPAFLCEEVKVDERGESQPRKAPRLQSQKRRPAKGAPDGQHHSLPIERAESQPRKAPRLQSQKQRPAKGAPDGQNHSLPIERAESQPRKAPRLQSQKQRPAQGVEAFESFLLAALDGQHHSLPIERAESQPRKAKGAPDGQHHSLPIEQSQAPRAEHTVCSSRCGCRRFVLKRFPKLRLGLALDQVYTEAELRRLCESDDAKLQKLQHYMSLPGYFEELEELKVSSWTVTTGMVTAGASDATCEAVQTVMRLATAGMEDRVALLQQLRGQHHEQHGNLVHAGIVVAALKPCLEEALDSHNEELALAALELLEQLPVTEVHVRPLGYVIKMIRGRMSSTQEVVRQIRSRVKRSSDGSLDNLEQAAKKAKSPAEASQSSSLSKGRMLRD
eukprot:TRINITY_DN13408_c0_g1_i1.p1 TRINITY_DN13408_c0_g1~~TRINITY_DN13408_c0_g1_i1.p1  ORF type:complete len:434 (+),score=103.64 TRINITY_DN13408_c0_g1_i1:73-1374(+)